MLVSQVFNDRDAVKTDYCCIKYFPDQLTTAKMCNAFVKAGAGFLGRVPDRLKTQEMCDEAVHRELYTLRHVPERFKTQEMPEKAFEKNQLLLKCVPDWFVTDERIFQAMKHISGKHCLFENIIKRQEGYKKCKVQKT